LDAAGRRRLKSAKIFPEAVQMALWFQFRGHLAECHIARAKSFDDMQDRDPRLVFLSQVHRDLPSVSRTF
jgi:hypothetical protein